MRLKHILKKKYDYKGSTVVILKTKDNLVTIENVETGLILKVQKHLVHRI
jgi:phage-related protein